MLQCLFEFWELKTVTRGKQFRRLDAPAGEDQLIAHLTHYNAYHENGHGASPFLSQGLGGGFGKVAVPHWVGTDRINRSTQALCDQCKLDNTSQLVPPNPTRPLLPVSRLKTYSLQRGPTHDRRDTQVHNPDARFARWSGSCLAILLKAGKKTRSGWAILCEYCVAG